MKIHKSAGILIFIGCVLIGVIIYLLTKKDLTQSKSTSYKSYIAADGNTWNNVLSEQFSGGLTDNWTPFTTNTDPTHSCSRYTDKDVLDTSSGELVIKVQPNSGGGWNTGRITSKKPYGPFIDPSNPQSNKEYWYFESTIKLNNNSNMAWPSFWLTPWNLDNTPPRGMNYYGKWPKSGEIDIFETINGQKQNYNTLHCPKWPSGKAADKSGYGVDVTQYHKYGCLWTSSAIYYYLDANFDPSDPNLLANFPNIGNSKPMASNVIAKGSNSDYSSCPDVTPVSTPGRLSAESPYDQPMNIVFNVAIGGDWAGGGSKCRIDGGVNKVPQQDSFYSDCNSKNCPGFNPGFEMHIKDVNVWKKVGNCSAGGVNPFSNGSCGKPCCGYTCFDTTTNNYVCSDTPCKVKAPKPGCCDKAPYCGSCYVDLCN